MLRVRKASSMGDPYGVWALQNSCLGDVITHYPSLEATNPDSAIYCAVFSEMEVTGPDGQESALLINTRPRLSPCTFSDGNPTGLPVNRAAGYLVWLWFMGPVTGMWRSIECKETPQGGVGGWGVVHVEVVIADILIQHNMLWAEDERSVP